MADPETETQTATGAESETAGPEEEDAGRSKISIKTMSNDSVNAEMAPLKDDEKKAPDHKASLRKRKPPGTPVPPAKSGPPPGLTMWEEIQWRARHQIVYSFWFDPFILAIIVANCILLAVDNPERASDALKKRLDAAEIAFTVIYILEMLIKFVAFGFIGTHEEPGSRLKSKSVEQRQSVLTYFVGSVFHHSTKKKEQQTYSGYFMDGWNVFDFIIVWAGSIIPLIVGTSSVASIRALRILRAVRTIPRVPKLRTLVMTLIESLPGLFGTGILLVFFFIVFGIVGVSFFAGMLRRQCYIETGDGKLLVPYQVTDVRYWTFCKGSEQCNKIGRQLGYNAEFGLTRDSYTCERERGNPNSGMENFDDIFFALLQVFQIITLQDWSKILYDLSRRTGYVSILYFVPLTFIVAFFALNLILAVLVETYSRSIKTVMGEEDFSNTIHEVDHLITLNQTKKSSKPVKQKITYENYERHVRDLKRDISIFEELFKEFGRTPQRNTVRKHELMKKTKMRIDTSRPPDDPTAQNKWVMELEALGEEEAEAKSAYDLMLADDDPTKWFFSQKANEQNADREEIIRAKMGTFNHDLATRVWRLARPIKDNYLKGKPDWVKIVNSWVTDEVFERVIIAVIVLNTIVLAIHWPDMSDGTKDVFFVLNICFTVVFTVECILKIIGLGYRRWVYDKFNVFDALVVVVSLIELAISGGDSEAGGAILAFRALRVLRVLRLLHRIRPLRILLNALIESFESVSYLFAIMFLFLFMFGVLGVQLFAGKVMKIKRRGDNRVFKEFTRPWRFDTLWYSMVTFLQLFTGDGMSAVMADTVQATTKAAALVVVVAVVIGVFIFRNLFLAILINRMGNQDEVQLMIDDLIVIARARMRKHRGDEEAARMEFEDDVKRVRANRLGNKAQIRLKRRMEKEKIQGKMFGLSLMYFSPKHPFRIKVHRMVTSDAFEMTINFFILVNCIFLAVDNPNVRDKSDLGQTLLAFNIFFTTIFAFELVAKVIAFGLFEGYCGLKQAPPEQAEDVVERNKEKGRKGLRSLANTLRGDEDEEDAKEAAEEAKEAEAEPQDWGTCKTAYLNSWWNRLDAFVVVMAIIGLGFPSVSFLRGLRAVRPIRIAIRIKQVKVVVKALMHSLTNVLNGILFAVFIMFVLAIIGTHIFSGQMGRCVVKGAPFTLADIPGKTRGDCKEFQDAGGGVEWVNAGFNFDNVMIGLLTIFKISNLAHWYEDLAVGMASSRQDSHRQAKPFNRPDAALFYMLVVCVGGFFIYNIVIAVVVDSFNRIKRGEESNILLTREQVVWVRKRRYLARFPIKSALKRPRDPQRAKFFDLVTHDYFEYFIITCILMNTIFLMTHHYSEPNSWTTALYVIEIVFIAVYSIEVILKWIGLGIPVYFRDPWNVFDFVIVVVSIIGLPFEQQGGAAVIRLLRVSRVVRLIKRAPVLRALFLTLVYAAPSLMNIGFLLLVIFFIWGIFGMEMFGRVFHNDGYGNLILYDGNDGITKSINFETFGNSLLVLYRIATNDNWGSILLAAGADYHLCNRDDVDTLNRLNKDLNFNYQCGYMWGAVIYFISFAVCGSLVMVNLFIAVILDTYLDNVEFEKRMEKLEVLRPWMEAWKVLDREEHEGKLKLRLPVKAFIATLKEAPELVGLMLDALNLRLSIEDVDDDSSLQVPGKGGTAGDSKSKIDYSDSQLVRRKSQNLYGRADFVGPANPADASVEVTNDHINAIFSSRRLRLLLRYHGSNLEERLVVVYSDAVFAIASLAVGPDFRLVNWTERYVHISDWWEEQVQGALMGEPF